MLIFKTEMIRTVKKKKGKQLDVFLFFDVEDFRIVFEGGIFLIGEVSSKESKPRICSSIAVHDRMSKRHHAERLGQC